VGRVRCLFDFENRRGEREPFFPDVDSRFKFSAFVCGGPKRTVDATECAFFLRDAPEKVAPDRRFTLTAGDFALVNPNTGTAPIFRTKRDAEITTAVYRRLPVLVARSNGIEKKAWPVRYLRMFDMTNDSQLFWARERLDAEGAYPAGMGRWRKGQREWLPLYVGRMIHQFDHRAASVTVNEENIHNPALSRDASLDDHADHGFTPTPQFWILSDEVAERSTSESGWFFAFRDIARSTDERTAIGAIIPRAAVGNTLPLILDLDAQAASSFAACFSSIIYDYVCRQKNQSTHLNWYIVEQLPVLTPKHYTRRFGKRTAAEIVKDHVLRLTYTAHDMAPFARDMGYLDKGGAVKPPIVWNEAERRHLRARLDALYFILYGITDEDDIGYILSTFPIVERKDREAFDGVYLTRELILWYKRALEAGDPDASAPEADLIRLATMRAAEH
jgi:hypothetical protein